MKSSAFGGARLAGSLALYLAASSAVLADQTISYSNNHPELQMWSYPAGSANGAGSVRDRGPTFGAYSGIDDETNETVFFPGSGLDPSRRGSVWIAGDTSTDLPVGLDPSRYQIDSLRITTTLLGNLIYEPLGYVLPYDNTLDTASALTTGGSDDAGHPIELYGIGLQGDYETIGFGDPNDENPFQLGDARWRRYEEGESGYDPELPANEQAFAPYQYYAVDAAGTDVENSVVGGYSATDPSGETGAFTPEPFAIGKLYDDQGVEYAPGTLTENGDVYVFEPDLSDERILDYVQSALSEGHLGFSLSSMHQPSGHTGTVAYPDFYLDDLDVGNNPDGAAPTIELLVTILDSPIPGDYDSDGDVDDDDYGEWVSLYGSTSPEADGNGDGVVNAADYTVWRDNYGAGVSPIAVPEPSGVQVIGMLGLTAVFCGWVRWFSGPTNPRGGRP